MNHLSRVAIVVFMCVSVGGIEGAPLPRLEDAKKLADKLGSDAPRIREEAYRKLRARPDANPWLRRLMDSENKTCSVLARNLLVEFDNDRQLEARAALEHAVRSNRLDAVIEWHQYWRPKKGEDLWSIVPPAGKAGLDMHARRSSDDHASPVESMHAKTLASERSRFYDFTSGFDRKMTESGVWHVRASDRLVWDGNTLAFASVGGPIFGGFSTGVLHFALGSIEAFHYSGSFVFFEGRLSGGSSADGRTTPAIPLDRCVVVGRGDLVGASADQSIILVDGDIDLSTVMVPPGKVIRNSLIRASGEIRLPKNLMLENCTIESHAKNPTAPYRLFELEDCGLSLADDEEGLVVKKVRPGSPFGNSGLIRGDVIRGIDDRAPGSSEEFRKKLRRASIRQGDCLLTVVRGRETFDLPAYFPLPK